jgi:predicted transcriptional regulator
MIAVIGYSRNDCISWINLTGLQKEERARFVMVYEITHTLGQSFDSYEETSLARHNKKYMEIKQSVIIGLKNKPK